MDVTDPAVREVMARNPALRARMMTRSGQMDIPTLMGLVSGMAPQKREVTPASPAPMQPAQIEAPRRTAPAQAPVLDPSAEIDALRPAFPAGGENRPPRPGEATRPTLGAIPPQQVLANEEMKARNAVAAAMAEDMPEEYRALIAKREERLGKELAEVKDAESRAGWEALALAGARMAASRNPSAWGAFAEGAGEGLSGFLAAKAARAKERSGIQEQAENLAILGLQQRQAAQDRALRNATLPQQLLTAALTARKGAGEVALNDATFGSEVQTAGLKPAFMRAQTENYAANAAESRARAGLAERTDPNIRSRYGGGGGGGPTNVDIRAIYNSLVVDRRQKAAAMTMSYDKREKARLASEIQAIDSEITKYRAMLLGQQSPEAAAFGRPVDTTPKMRYVPGKGLVPNQ